ncbi:MAG: DNA adenine methylase [Microcoleaceae cyanobacterium]
MSSRKKSPLAKPFLKWAGGKRQLIKELIKYMPKRYDTYYEPFLGGGAFLLELQPDPAIINDTNSELINCYSIIKFALNELIEELKPYKNDEDYYYEVRKWDRQKDYNSRTSIERAARIIFLNKTCYNGLFRVNSKAQFNVPFGRYKKPNILDEAVLKAVSQYLNKADVKILNTDFAEAVKTANKNDFIYFDPPYDPVSNTASFTGYDVNGFNRDQQKRLKKVVDELTDRGCKVMLSNSYTDFIIDLYQDYTQVKLSATRAINSKASRRGKVDEILVMNYC